MADSKPEFDPSKPFRGSQDGRPTFDPSKPFSKPGESPVEKPVWDGSFAGLGSAIDQAKKYKEQQDNVPEGSKDKPVESDIFGSDTDRAKSSFGDTRGIGKMLVQKGFVDFDKNKNGDLVAKDKDGKWHKDANGLLSNPVNWAESSAGKALPTAGGIAGGIIASPTGPGAIGAAAAGGASGEAARIGIGKGLGVYDGGLGDAAADIGKEGLTMAAGEGLGKYGVAPMLDAAAPYAGRLLSKITPAAPEMISKEVPTGLLDSSGSPLMKTVQEQPAAPAPAKTPEWLKTALTYAGAKFGGPVGAVAAPKAADLAAPAVQAAGRGVGAIASSPWVQSVMKNPHLIQSIANPELRDAVSQAIAKTGEQVGGSSHDEPHYDPKDQKMVSQDAGKQQFLDGN